MTDALLATHVDFPQPPPPAPRPKAEPRRFGHADLVELGPWIAKRICERRPELSPLTVQSQLAAHMNSNDALFLRLNKAVLLAVTASSLFQTPWIEEVFGFEVLTGAEGEEPFDLLELYIWLGKWTASRGVSRIKILNHTDMNRPLLQLYVGKTKQEKYDTLIVSAG